MDIVKVFVKFLIHPDGDLMAYFPYMKADNKGNKTCYAHIGQHSACSPEYAKECRYAGTNEYGDLKTELESIGYELRISKSNLFEHLTDEKRKEITEGLVPTSDAFQKLLKKMNP